jgi:glycosyltransferase involved in cell wall biosynthesis
LLEPRLSRSEARRRLGLPSEGFLGVYAGHTGPEKGVDVLVEMAAAVPSARVLIVGASPDSADGRRLLKAARDAGATNVICRARVPLAEVGAYLYAADCLLVPPTATPLERFRRTVLPMKLFMYLAAGRPILAPGLPDIQEVLTDGLTARLVAPQDVGAASSAFAALVSDRNLADRLSENARAAATAYTWAARARRIVEWMPAANPVSAVG